MNPLTRGHSTASTEVAADSRVHLHEALFARLDTSVAELWQRARNGRLWEHVFERGCSPELYRQTLFQIYHYTQHNPLNQAVAALRTEPAQHALLRFVFEHAREELGHERMALNDLVSAGLWEAGQPIDPPLPATDALINYLYGVALRDGAIARLGYSYWAESAYAQLNPLLERVCRSLALKPHDLSFFSAHSEIDVRHAAQVRNAIEHAVTTPQQADAVHRVAVTSLWLTVQLLEQAFESVHATEVQD